MMDIFVLIHPLSGGEMLLRASRIVSVGLDEINGVKHRVIEYDSSQGILEPVRVKDSFRDLSRQLGHEVVTSDNAYSR